MHIISRIYCDPPLGHSDHCIVNFVLDIINSPRHINPNPQPSCSSVAECRYNWHKADYDAIAWYICNIDWNSLLCHNPSALSFWSAFLDILWSAVENYVPRINGTRQANHKSYPHEIRKLIAKKGSCTTSVDYTRIIYICVGNTGTLLANLEMHATT